MAGASLPDALEAFPVLRERIGAGTIALFLDLDGTLAPIADRPDLVEVPATTLDTVDRLARLCPVAVVSGRGLEDLKDKIGLQSVYYVADHGFQISGPLRDRVAFEMGREARPQLEQAARQLHRALDPVGGVLIEEKGLSLSVHYRLTPEARHPAVLRAVADVAEMFPVLRVTEGKLVYEFRPPGDWDKGKAVLWLMDRLAPDKDRLPIAIGDDLTDEDMFTAVEGWGVGVIVGDPGRPTRATYRVKDHLEAARLLDEMRTLLAP